MQPYCRDKVANRLKKLREGKGWSVTEMGSKLNDVLGFDGGLEVMSLSGNSGKHTVSQLETLNGKRNITADIAAAYADIFGVTLDYIYGYSDDWEIDYRPAKEITGLPDSTIKKLSELLAMKGDIRDSIRSKKAQILSCIIEDKDLNEMLICLLQYLHYAHFADQSSISQEAGEYTGSDYTNAEDVLFSAGEAAITHDVAAVAKLHEACDVFKTIARNIPVTSTIGKKSDGSPLRKQFNGASKKEAEAKRDEYGGQRHGKHNKADE